MNFDLPKIVDSLLSERNFEDKIIWQRDQEWLASLVVALVEERARAYKLCDMAAHREGYDWAYDDKKRQQSLGDFEIDPAKYAELKKRLENAKPEDE